MSEVISLPLLHALMVRTGTTLPFLSLRPFIFT